MLYDVKDDELLFELFCRAIYAPRDLTELNEMYQRLGNKAKDKVSKAHEVIGRLLELESGSDPFVDKVCDRINEARREGTLT